MEEKTIDSSIKARFVAGILISNLSKEIDRIGLLSSSTDLHADLVEAFREENEMVEKYTNQALKIVDKCQSDLLALSLRLVANDLEE